MYEKFFHLDKSPFGMTPDPSCLLMTDSHREALSGLMYAILKRKGFVVLTGDAGTGKTTLLRALIRSAKSARFSVVLNPTLSLTEFFELVLLDFGITDVPASKAQRIFRLQELLVKCHNDGYPPVLIVDEAHKLSPEILEEIRLLTNFETSDRKLLQIVLAGQTELSALLSRQDLRQLKQRIEIRLEIKPLSTSDVGIYMRHRWERAGGTTAPPFTPAAVSMIAAASRGIPRLVNSICDNALLLAYGNEDSLITDDHIRQVIRDLDIDDFQDRGFGRKLERLALDDRFVQRTGPATAGPLPTSFPTIERYSAPPKPTFMERLANRLNFSTVQTARINDNE
jgi:general secretion pathway protein A